MTKIEYVLVTEDEEWMWAVYLVGLVRILWRGASYDYEFESLVWTLDISFVVKMSIELAMIIFVDAGLRPHSKSSLVKV